MQRVELFTTFQRLFTHRHITDDGGHAGHGLTQFVTGQLDFLTLTFQLFDDGGTLLPCLLVFLDTIAPDDDDDDHDDEVEGQHPPRQPPRTVDVYLQDALLVADSTIGTDCFDVELIVATAQLIETDTME